METKLNNYESPRLFSRAWKASDIALLAEVETDKGFKAFCYPPSYDLSSEEKRIAFINTKMETYAEFKICKLPVFLESNNEFIGLMGIEPFNYKGEAFFEIGYRLLEKYWRKGYVKEFAPFLIASFQETHPETRLAALVHVENARSISLTESFGFHKIETFEHNASSHWWLRRDRS